MPQLKIREMPQDERPREKLLARGADALSNAELIAILLRTGRRGMNVVDVARELLDKYKSFAELSRCSVKELSEIKGIGPAKALELVAAFNLGKRFTQEPLSQQKLDSPELIYKLLGDEMRMMRTESLRVVLLDTRYRLMRIESVSVGSMNESIAHPREIFRPAITYSAYAVIVVHNHPSGDPSPSQDDHSLTRRLPKPLSFCRSNYSITSSSARHRTAARLFQFQRGRRVVGKTTRSSNVEILNMTDARKFIPTAIVDPNAKIGADVEIGRSQSSDRM